MRQAVIIGYFSLLTVEAGLYLLGESDYDKMRIGYEIHMFEVWYKGDGVYGDGKDFIGTITTVLLIQPMYVDELLYLSMRKQNMRQ